MTMTPSDSRLAYRISKRVIDVVGSSALLAVSAVPMVLVAVAVRASARGPVLYRGRRVGVGGVEFLQLKFRSMRSECAELRNPDGSTVASTDDPRVTGVGRFLRRWSLDELPQLFNVLRGDMSLVGPRPDPPDALSRYRPQDFARLSVLPGLTGWAALHGRNTVSWERRRDLDLEYVQSCSLWMDLKIIAQTPGLVLLGTGVNGPKRQEGALR
jgi:lipopolysaccharide/colanic/teichoic acid biosynthesis glycosyltransferase